MSVRTTQLSLQLQPFHMVPQTRRDVTTVAVVLIPLLKYSENICPLLQAKQAKAASINKYFPKYRTCVRHNMKPFISISNSYYQPLIIKRPKSTIVRVVAGGRSAAARSGRPRQPRMHADMLTVSDSGGDKRVEKSSDLIYVLSVHTA